MMSGRHSVCSQDPLHVFAYLKKCFQVLGIFDCILGVVGAVFAALLLKGNTIGQLKVDSTQPRFEK